MSIHATEVPEQTFGALFSRFLRFGLLAWGGPVAQVAMIKRELVEEERWIAPEQFNRVYAMYQVLPGPEAHELCVYFGTLARGRLGGLLAGLGFMLPGFLLMWVLSWAYVRYGISSGAVAPVLAGLQAGVIALIAGAVHRIGRHAVTDRWLLAIAAISAAAAAAGLQFLIGLALAGLVYECVRREQVVFAGIAGSTWIGLAIVAWMQSRGSLAEVPATAAALASAPSLPKLFGSGLRSGLLTFGGASTVIPYLQHDAVRVGGWMTDAQFLDGLGLSGILPAPLIIFATFVGYLAPGDGWRVRAHGRDLPARLRIHNARPRTARTPDPQRALARLPRRRDGGRDRAHRHDFDHPRPDGDRQLGCGRDCGRSARNAAGLARQGGGRRGARPGGRGGLAAARECLVIAEHTQQASDP